MEVFLSALRNKYIFLECYLKSLEIMILISHERLGSFLVFYPSLNKAQLQDL